MKVVLRERLDNSGWIPKGCLIVARLRILIIHVLEEDVCRPKGFGRYYRRPRTNLECREIAGGQRKVRKTIEEAISRSTSSKMIQMSGIQKGKPVVGIRRIIWRGGG